MLLYFDKMSMAASLEVRVPFMDHDVVAFCSALPDARRVWLGRRKELLKRASRGLVDDAIIDKKKRGFFHAALGAWLRAHRDDLDPRNTYFVNVDTVGNGTVHHVTAEGFLLAFRHDPLLIELCEEMGSAPRVWRTGTDGVLPAMSELSSITICCADGGARIPHLHRASDTVENVDPAAVEAACNFLEEMVRRIDRAIGRRQERARADTEAASA
jgi:hypothetical protein